MIVRRLFYAIFRHDPVNENKETVVLFMEKYRKQLITLRSTILLLQHTGVL